MRRLSLPLFLVSLLLGLVACTARPTSSPTTPITVRDALGREVTFAAPPQRIVVAGKATIMIVDALYLFPEGPQRLAAVGSTGQGGDFLPIVDPNAAAKATLGSDAGPEQIAAARPDLVLLKSYLAEKLGQPVEALGIPVFYVSLETPEQYFTEIRALGRILGNEARAEEVLAFYQERMDRVRRALEGLPDDQKPGILVLQHAAKGGETAYSVPPASWMQTLLVQMAGGRPVWLDVPGGQGWTVVTLEQVAAWNPDQMYLIDYFGDPVQAVEALKNDPVARGLRAVRSGQVFAFPKDTYSWDQPDPRWILGLQWLAAHIHPDRFTVDITAEFSMFYRALYRLDEATIEGKLRPLLRGSLP
ncbi:MAG: ABC transporter substrate-binding protein [Thermoflexia bacterium]|nr:MAG: ABC transporter substrate-binding protein [Thermoflexia bacterium]